MEQIVTTSDWKLFRERLPDWQEKFMSKLLKEYSVLLEDKTKSSADRFWELESRLKEDKRLTGVNCQMSKSEVVWNLICLYREGAISFEDLDGFSEKLIDRIKIAVM